MKKTILFLALCAALLTGCRAGADDDNKREKRGEPDNVEADVPDFKDDTPVYEGETMEGTETAEAADPASIAGNVMADFIEYYNGLLPMEAGYFKIRSVKRGADGHSLDFDILVDDNVDIYQFQSSITENNLDAARELAGKDYELLAQYGIDVVYTYHNSAGQGFKVRL